MTPYLVAQIEPNYPFKKGLENDKELKTAYSLGREKYLKSLDFDYLNWVYDIAIKDQIDKSKTNYDDEIEKTIDKLLIKIKSKGFPGERIIGIGDSNIFTEIGKPNFNLKNKKERFEQKIYLKAGDNHLCAKLPILLLMHHKCSYEKLKIYIYEEIKKGNIHPRDVGLIFDNVLRFKNRMPKYCSKKIPKTFFHLINNLIKYPESTKIKVNKHRERHFIASYEIDEIKKEYREKHNFNFKSGFWGNR